MRFEEDLRITIQSLGWQSEGRYLPLEDDLASVAYWYQLEPHNPFPDFPTKEKLAIVDEYPITGMLETNLFVDEAPVTLASHPSVEAIYYTTDGSAPTPESTRYTDTFSVTEECTVRARGYTGGAPATPIVEGKFHYMMPQKAISVTPANPGLKRAFFVLDTALESTRELEGLKPNRTDVTPMVQFPDEPLPERFGLRFDGYFKAPKAGIYTFALASNDGSMLAINDIWVVDNDGPHGELERRGQIALEAGYHPFRVDYFQAGAAMALKVFVEGPGMPRQEIPESSLAH